MSCVNCNCYSCEIARYQKTNEVKAIYKPCMFCGLPVHMLDNGRARATICTGCNVAHIQAVPI